METDQAVENEEYKKDISETEEILGDILRLSDIEISNLFDQGVVASPNYNKN